MANFEEYYLDQKCMQELLLYVHNNFKLISTKMLSEMRRHHGLEPNTNDHIVLLMMLHSLLFREMISCICGLCKNVEVSLDALVDAPTQQLLAMLLTKQFDFSTFEHPMTEEFLKKGGITGFNEFYLKEVGALREDKSALPKEK